MYKPKKISSFIPQIIGSSKKNNKLIELKANWENIVGKKFSKKCYVSGLRQINKKNILTIISCESDLLELSYSTEVIKNKINNFYSYDFIDIIKFKKSLQL